MSYFKDEEKAFERLNENNRDDLEMMETIGASYFRTSQLWRMQGRLDEKQIWMKRLQRTAIVFAAMSPIWLIMSFFFAWLGQPQLAKIAACLFPVSLTFFLISVGLISKYFKGNGHLEKMDDRISTELKQRKSYEEDPQDLWKAGLN